jgi:hypothetical protein
MVPIEWSRRLSAAQLATTFKVAHHLLFESFKNRRQTIQLANGALMMQGVTRWQKWRALKELETLGLVAIAHRERKSPEITLLYPAEGA